MESTGRKRCFHESAPPPDAAAGVCHKKSRQCFQEQLEQCYPRRCLCSLDTADLHEYLEKFTQSPSEERTEGKSVEDEEEQSLLVGSCLVWIGSSCHEQLVLGRVCPAMQAVVGHILRQDGRVLPSLFSLIKVTKACDGDLGVNFSVKLGTIPVPTNPW